jgi:hypothetical protein
VDLGRFHDMMDKGGYRLQLTALAVAFNPPLCDVRADGGGLEGLPRLSGEDNPVPAVRTRRVMSEADPIVDVRAPVIQTEEMGPVRRGVHPLPPGALRCFVTPSDGLDVVACPTVVIVRR